MIEEQVRLLQILSQGGALTGNEFPGFRNPHALLNELKQIGLVRSHAVWGRTKYRITERGREWLEEAMK